MKIAFWGEERGCGTTMNMYAIAGLLSCECPDKTVRLYRERGVAKKTSKGREKRTGGMDADGIFFFDCGSGMSERTKRMFKTADLVVINLKQEKDKLDSFFLQYISIAREPVFLLGNYSEFGNCNRKAVENNYRIPADRLGVVVYNNEYCYAFERDRGMEFIKRGMFSSEKNRQFGSELKRSLELILRRLEAEV